MTWVEKMPLMLGDSGKGRQRWEGWESKAGAETERIRKQKNKKTENQKRRSGNWYSERVDSRIFGEIYFLRSFP